MMTPNAVMPNTKPTILHKIPLTILLADDGTVELTCKVKSIVVSVDGDCLCLEHEMPTPTGNKHQYCYTIATPPPDATYVHYVAVFSGPGPLELVPWAQDHGLAQSPIFDVATDTAGQHITVVVVSEPRPPAVPAARNVVNAAPRSRPIAAAPRPSVARRHVKSDFQGGGDEL